MGEDKYLTISSSGGEGMMIVDPALPAAGSLTPVGLTSPPLDDDREIIPKNAADITYFGTDTRLAVLPHCFTVRQYYMALASLLHKQTGPETSDCS